MGASEEHAPSAPHPADLPEPDSRASAPPPREDDPLRLIREVFPGRVVGFTPAAGEDSPEPAHEHPVEPDLEAPEDEAFGDAEDPER